MPGVAPPPGAPTGDPSHVTAGPSLDQRIKKLMEKGGHQKQLGNLRAKRYLGKQQPAQLPFDAQYDATASGLTRDLNFANQDIGFQQQQLSNAYGFDNPSANPYSRAALLQKSYDADRNGTINSSAASGQLYSGATQRGLDSALFDYGQGLNTERSSYAAATQDLTNQGVSAANDYTQGLMSAKADALQRALDVAVDPSEAPGLPDFVKQYLKRQKKRPDSKVKGRNIKPANTVHGNPKGK